MIARWLNAGIADALAQYVKRRDQERDRQTSEHLGFIAHELRNPLSAARVALQRLRNRERELTVGGRTVDLLERSLRRASDMIDNTLSHASLQLGVEPRLEPLALGDLLRDIEAGRRHRRAGPRHRSGHGGPGDTGRSPPIRACSARRCSTWFRTRSSSAPPVRRSA